MASISKSQSETKTTKEYVVKINDDELGIENLSLGVIDTPGLNDTEGPEQDYRNLATIKNFMKNHKPLQYISQDVNTYNPVFPNVVLLLVNATEKRYKGEGSSLSKSLMAIKEINLVDRKNFLIVITNVLSFGNGKTHPKEWKKELDKKSKEIKKMAKKILKVSAQVVWVENHFYNKICPEYLKSAETQYPKEREESTDDDESEDDTDDNESEEDSNDEEENDSETDSNEEEEEDIEDDDQDEVGHNLKQVGEWTVLPDGTKQILNLHKAFAKMLKNNGDNLGLHTINTLFE